MFEHHQEDKLRLPTTIAGRIVVGALCLLLLPFSSLLWLGMAFNGNWERDLEGWVTNIVVGSLFFSLMMFSLVGLIWTISNDQTAKKLFVYGCNSLAVAVFLFCCLSACYVFWTLGDM